MMHRTHTTHKEAVLTAKAALAAHKLGTFGMGVALDADGQSYLYQGGGWIVRLSLEGKTISFFRA